MKHCASYSLALLFVVLLFLGTGCGPNYRNQSSPSRTERYEDNSSDDDTYEDGSGEEQTGYEEENEDPRSKERMARRQQEHRRSLQNMGQWLLTAIIGIGINVLIFVLLSS